MGEYWSGEMNLDELHEIQTDALEKQKHYAHRLHVCMGTGCLSQRSDKVKESLEAEVRKRGLEETCRVERAGCMGLCAAGPLVRVDPEGTLYERVRPGDETQDAAEVVESIGKKPVERLQLDTGNRFFSAQYRVVLENAGRIDPERIEDYIAAGGYEALLTALSTMSPSEVIEEVKKSGLRGRGGAGYPTGLKWSTVAKARGTGVKYVICNGDEGDPGAFMDRSVMESDPQRVLEGMAVGAYAVGASQGYIYLRAEYPLAIKRLKAAIKQAESHGLLGNNISDTQFSFNIQVRLGAGAFVCGEETALIESVEGKRGTPRPRPPYPAMEGLFGEPTLINNVETFANIPPIIRSGGEWYAKIGTEKSKGTKVFALTGKVRNIGLVEVPMGITLREMVFDIGGGIPDGKVFKAVQTGGPSGGCLPSDCLDMPVDYESLAKAGSIMGSGGMIVMDETSCMVDVAKYFMEFCMTESCGKCIPCRVGTYQMHRILTAVADMTATEQDVHMLEELCDLLKHTSLCGLGQSAPNPVVSTLRAFAAEYRAHILERKCPAGVCGQKPAGETV
jgi:bidirectional [NiFe] hydrogenase diaphorase subunit